MIDLSKYNLETLRKDEELILYRARSKDDGTQVLVLSLVAGYPKPESLTRLEHARPAVNSREIVRASERDRYIACFLLPRRS